MKKVLEIIKTTLVWLVVLLAVSMMIFTVISVTTFNRNDRSLFGFKMYIVNSDSMAATDFNAGDLILVKEVDPSTLKEGDIITFMSQPMPKGILVSSRTVPLRIQTTKPSLLIRMCLASTRATFPCLVHSLTS